ncbi:unnamed protein product [Brassica napus]|uniref:(rape) hypothetical protein n=1 Tax=Brassica napus TaxID=3708 RepID=A0A816QV52_BRANA|nr:unnamed protein product [Brassica napus]
MVDGSSARWRAVIRVFNETVRFMVNLTSSNRWRRSTSKCVSESPCFTTRVSFSSVVSFSKTSSFKIDTFSSKSVVCFFSKQSAFVMWKLASKSIKEGFRSKDDVTQQRNTPLDSSGDGVKTTKEERLECPICWESFNVVENVPYVLWCGHTICKYCLLGLQRAVVNKSSGFPFQLPFFVACPWCSFLSLRLVRNGTIKFPSKNYYLLWMVETMNGSRSDNNKRVTPGQRRCDGVTSDDNRGWWNGLTRGWRLHDSVRKSMALAAHLLAKFPLIVVFLLVALYAIPVSAAVLGVYVFVTFALAVPSFLVLYFAVPSLNWLIREISA